MPSIGIPPLAGLATYEEASNPGLGVDDNVERLRRYNYIEGQLYKLSAAFLNPTPEWEVKGALSLHLYLDAEHSQALRSRVAELRRPPLYLDKCPDSRLEALCEEALRSKTTVELLVAIFKVLRPSLLSAYRTHLASVNPVFDFPTARIMRQAIPEEEQMIEWGQSALEALLKSPEDRDEALAWETHLNAFLAAAGGVSGLEAIEEEAKLPAKRAVAPFVADVDPKRDWRSGDIYNFSYRANDVYLDPEADYDERVLALMYKRFHEMDVPEMMASIVLQTPGKPWEYYRDLGRQLWDEARHSMMGEVWFAKIGYDWSKYPNHVGWGMHLNLDREPLDRHIILYFIEQNLMDKETGKRLEWMIAQSANDDLATYFQDYDWADEVLHAQIGRRWLKPAVGDVKAIIERAKEIAAMDQPSIKSRSATTPQTDWWPDFVQEALGKPSTSQAGDENKLIPTFSYVASGEG